MTDFDLLQNGTSCDEQVSDAPIEIVSTNDATIKEKVEKIAAKNLQEEFKEINDIPSPENVTTNASNASHGSWPQYQEPSLTHVTVAERHPAAEVLVRSGGTLSS